VRPVRPGTEGALASYCFKGTTMRWSTEGSRTPMAILSDLESTGEGFALWEEFNAAVSADRRAQVITSLGASTRCAPGPATILIGRGMIRLPLFTPILKLWCAPTLWG
jgi:hypothetical protein